VLPENALYCDNQGAITTANQPTYMVSGRSKHIDVRFHVIRDAAANGLLDHTGCEKGKCIEALKLWNDSD